MDHSQERNGIMQIESLTIASELDDIPSPDYSMHPYMSLPEDFELAAFVERNLPVSAGLRGHVLAQQNSPSPTETPDLLECICSASFSESEVPAVSETKSTSSYHVTFKDNEISATSSQFSQSEKDEQYMEDPKSSEGSESAVKPKASILRRSSKYSRPDESEDLPPRTKSPVNSKSTPKRTSMELRSSRKRKSESGAQEGYLSKVPRTQSLSRNSKSLKSTQPKRVSDTPRPKLKGTPRRRQSKN